MATVKFILKHNKTIKNPKRTDATPVLMVFRFGQEQIRFYPGEKVPPKFWITKDCRAREGKQFDKGKNINTRLETIEQDVLSVFRDHLNENKVPIINKLKDEIKAVVRPQPINEPEKITFFGAIENYIRDCNKAKRTKLSYGTTLNVLKQYDETLKDKLTFDSINMDFYNEFMNYLTHVRQFSVNTIGGHIKEVKVFMNYANDKGYTTNTGHLHRKFKKIEETPETIYLNDKELVELYKLNLKKNPKLDRVRDLFIIGCYTGLRFSDLSQLTPEKFIKDDTQLKLKTVKTGEMVVIPLHWTIKHILKKYDGATPRAISNQKMNEYLKQLGEKAKIKEKITFSKTKGGLSYDQTREKYELMTVHTARRSFATNMYLAGVPTISIMKITGHRTERAFLKYIKITSEQNADKLSKHPYFIEPLKVVKRKKAVNH